VFVSGVQPWSSLLPRLAWDWNHLGLPRCQAGTASETVSS